MDIVVAIRSLLLANRGITTLVDERIRPFYGAQLDVRPFVTALVTSSSGTLTHGGRAGSTNAVLEIGIIGDTYDDVKTLAGSVDQDDGIRGTLDGYVGLPAKGGVRICPCVYDDETDIEQTNMPGASTPIFLKTINFRVRYQAAPTP